MEIKREDFEELVVAVEVAAMLLAEVDTRFGKMKIMDVDFTKEHGELTYGDGAAYLDVLIKKYRDRL